MTFTHIRIELVKEGPKTNQWVVYNKYEDVLIGCIKWFGRWRKYAFFPEAGCVFEEVCMRELSDFILEQTKQQRAARA